jgi:hypothetical protein
MVRPLRSRKSSDFVIERQELIKLRSNCNQFVHALPSLDPMKSTKSLQTAQMPIQPNIHSRAQLECAFVIAEQNAVDIVKEDRFHAHVNKPSRGLLANEVYSRRCRVHPCH